MTFIESTKNFLANFFKQKSILGSSLFYTLSILLSLVYNVFNSGEKILASLSDYKTYLTALYYAPYFVGLLTILGTIFAFIFYLIDLTLTKEI